MGVSKEYIASVFRKCIGYMYWLKENGHGTRGKGEGHECDSRLSEKWVGHGPISGEKHFFDTDGKFNSQDSRQFPASKYFFHEVN
jgi:hypothetical protein